MNKTNMNDMVVLAKLRQNARERLTKMSRNTSIPVTTLYNKIKELEGSFIKKHTSILDFSKLGFNTRAMVIMKVKKDMREKVRDFLSAHRNVNSIYKINNGFDYLVEVVFKEVRDVESFVEIAESSAGVDKSVVHYVIDDVKREDFMSNPEYLKITDSAMA